MRQARAPDATNNEKDAMAGEARRRRTSTPALQTMGRHVPKGSRCEGPAPAIGGGEKGRTHGCAPTTQRAGTGASPYNCVRRNDILNI